MNKIDTSSSRPDFRVLADLLPYLWPAGETRLRQRVVLACVFLIVGKIISVLVPLFYKESVDALTSEKLQVLSVPVFLIIAYGISRILSQGLNELRDAVFAKVEQRAIRIAALKIFKHLHSLSLKFHLDRKTGGLSRAIERGTKAIETILRFSTFNIFPTLLEILFVCVTLWYLYDIKYMALTLLTLVLYIWYTIAITTWRTAYVRKMNTVDSEANSKAIDSLLNYETVKYFGNEHHELHRYNEWELKYEAAAVKSKVSLSVLNIGQGVIIAIGLILVMLYAGRDVVSNQMTVGDYVLVNTYLIQLYMPLNILGFAYREIKLAIVDMEQMFSLLDVPQDIKDKPDAVQIQPQQGEVVFDRVSFSYIPERLILKDISFTIPAGHTVAIVGESGAGKSTISRLLFRFYDVTDGCILIDGQDIRNVTQDSLRKLIGIVPQDTVLFNDTIYYNIAYGRPDATEEEVIEAAKMAKIHDFITILPDGYQTIVGERGLKLSGGEKQRVAIARTLLKHPLIFLFDEATSALDTHTEKAIQRSLLEVSTDRTTLIIAHRLSTVIHSDTIIVLDKGEIVEKGSHPELLAKNGLYAAMWSRQQESSRSA